ncbi:MAG TPA: urease accessory protein UreD [Flavitalea sp.]|nr:urease accessory protein UreD [Flavitalea sp.]
MIHKLDITAALKNGRTILKDCFFNQPFRVVNISEDKTDPVLYLVVMSSSPGLLSEDEYSVNIDVEAGAALMLQSQAYQRIFKMKGSARVQQHIDIGKGGTLFYIPHPVVPHAGSTLVSETTITLAESSRLLFSDIITCGRKHSGEVFQFASLRSRLTVKRSFSVIYRDNIVLEPAPDVYGGIGQFENFTHQAGFLMADYNRKIDEQILENVHDILKTDASVSFGITRANDHMLAGRILANGGEQLYTLLKKVETFAGNHWKAKPQENEITEPKETFSL